jgi:gluconate 5-dehydrogenase
VQRELVHDRDHSSSTRAVLDRFGLDGRTALVTGGGRGIGRAIALGLASAGADVCVAARHEEELATVVEEVRELGRRASFVVADLLDHEGRQRLVGAAVETLGSVDILVNNAGSSVEKSAFVDVAWESWERHLALLLTAQAAVTQAAVRSMVDAGRPGVVINVSSIYGLRGAPGGEKTLGSHTYYAAAKHGLVGLTRALGIELAPHGIRVNALCPGWVDTSMNPIGAAPGGFLARNLDQIPMGRWATPDEMVGPALFLASDASSFMTGQTLVVDGGHLA